jgi:CBS domain-containing protein
MSLDRFCRKQVVTATANEDIDSVSHLMREAHVGAVVVVNEGDRPVGIVTDRDIVCRVVANGLAPRSTRVADVMTRDPRVAYVQDTIDTAIFRMRQSGLRRLPIVDAAGKLAGLVSLDDLLVLLSAELGQAAGTVRGNAGP